MLLTEIHSGCCKISQRPILDIFDYAAEALKVLNKTVSYRHPSIGTFSTELITQYWFGLPRNVAFGSLQVDLDIVEYSVVSRDNNAQDTKNAVNILGMMGSMLEGEVPAIFGSSQQHSTKPVSAMHVLATAMQTGMKIYTVNSTNQQIINTLAISAEVKADISNAINSGREVVVPEGDVLIGNWVGAGYIINDPVAGAGVYRISGGLNGGKIATTVITEALTVIGLVGEFFLNAVIPVANADVRSCEEEEGNDTHNIHFNWIATLVLALIFIFIISTLGPLVGPGVPAMVLLFISLNEAQAAGMGCPTYVSGAISSRGKSMEEATAHVKSAIVPAVTDELTYLETIDRIMLHDSNDHGWYNATEVCKKDERDKEENKDKSCDEYPFFSTFEGGKGRWGESGGGWVSLRLIKAAHNHVQGGTLSPFYKQCGLSTGDRFRVRTSDGVTERLDKEGKPCGFISHVR